MLISPNSAQARWGSKTAPLPCMAFPLCYDTQNSSEYDKERDLTYVDVPILLLRRVSVETSIV
jgi:hypothetical protein